MASTAITDNVLTMVHAAGSNMVSKAVIEVLSETSPVVRTAPASECNDGTTHKVTIRDSIPDPTFRTLNSGAAIVNSGNREFREHTGLLEAWVEADEDLLKLSGDKRQVLYNQAKGILEGMAQAGENAIFYADHDVNQSAFSGFTPRYNSLDPSRPETRNIIDAGGVAIPDVSRPGYSTNLTSIWLIQWAEDACHLLYPKGTSSGVTQKVFSNQVLRDAITRPFEGTMIRYQWYLGLAVSDWRRAVRICNVDVNQLASVINGGAPTAADWKLLRLMTYALSLLPPGGNQRTSFYCNRIPHTLISMLSSEKSNVNLTYRDPAGDTPIVPKFQGYNLSRCDGLITGEKFVTV